MLTGQEDGEKQKKVGREIVYDDIQISDIIVRRAQLYE